MNELATPSSVNAEMVRISRERQSRLAKRDKLAMDREAAADVALEAELDYKDVFAAVYKEVSAQTKSNSGAELLARASYPDVKDAYDRLARAKRAFDRIEAALKESKIRLDALESDMRGAMESSYTIRQEMRSLSYSESA